MNDSLFQPQGPKESERGNLTSCGYLPEISPYQNPTQRKKDSKYAVITTKTQSHVFSQRSLSLFFIVQYHIGPKLVMAISFSGSKCIYKNNSKRTTLLSSMCSKLTKRKQDQRQLTSFLILIYNFEHIQQYQFYNSTVQTISGQCSLSKAPENIRTPEVLCFQEVQKGNIGLKQINLISNFHNLGSKSLLVISSSNY